MFGEKLSRFYHVSRYEFESRSVYQGADGAERLNKIWFRSYEETFAENRTLLSRFLRGLSEKNIIPNLVIPPFYLRGIDEASKDAFLKKRERFYRALRDIQEETGLTIRIFDYSDVFADRRELFMDITHLNSAGAVEFTELINQNVL